MSTTVITGTTITTGYVMAAGVAVLVVDATAEIIGTAGASGKYFGQGGGSGGIGLSSPFVATIDNAGQLVGGAGGAAGGGGVSGQGGAGVSLASGASLGNTGTVTGGLGGAGAVGGSFAAAGAQGGAGVVEVGAAAVTNSGLIQGGASGAAGAAEGGIGGIAGVAGGDGLDLGAGGGVANFSTILGGAGGAGIGAGQPAGAQGDGISLAAGGTVTNGNGTIGTGLIQGGVGINAGAGGAATIVNYGTIGGTSGDSVQFKNTADRLIAESGAVFTGAIEGGGGALEVVGGFSQVSGLGGAGTLSGAISASFSGFGSYAIDAGVLLYLNGANTVGAAQSLTNAGSLVSLSGLTTLDTGTNTVVNTGSLEAAGPGVLLIKTTVEGAGGGALYAGEGGHIELDGGVVLDGSVTITSGCELETLNHASTIKAGVSVASFGTILVTNGANLDLAGTVHNSGVIAVAGGATFTGLLADAAGLTLSGAGVVSLSATGYIGGTGALTNLGNTIVGGGIIKGVTLTNDGTIDDNVGRMVLNTGGTVSNNGLIESTGTGTLLIRGTTIDSSGGGTVSDGKRLQLSNATLTGGVLTVASGAVLITDAGGGTVVGTLTNAGVIDGSAGGLTIVGDVANSGLAQALNGHLTITGALTGSGTARVFGSGVLELDGASAERTTFAAGATGQLVLGDVAAFTGRIYGFSHTGTNSLDLKGVLANGHSYFGSAVGGTLTLTENGTTVASIKLGGDFRTSKFNLNSDGAGGTVITDPMATKLTTAMAGFGAPVGPALTLSPRPAGVHPVLAMGHAL